MEKFIFREIEVLFIVFGRALNFKRLVPGIVQGPEKSI
jgi:hypothetical protein